MTSFTLQTNHTPHVSRFVTRWLASDPNRQAELDTSIALDLNMFQSILNSYLNTGCALDCAMRQLRNRIIVSLIMRDLNGQANLDEVLNTMSSFASYAIETHLHALNDELCAIFGVPIGEESNEPQSLIVLGMGKLGGQELNVSSDIDLIFVYPEEGETRPQTSTQRQISNHEFFAKLGKKLIMALADITECGFTFRVDMALRPNGTSGPLACSFNMLEKYFLTQGREWERYAWIKARPITGNTKDIGILQNIIHPFVFRRYLDFGAIDALRTLHAQIRAEVIRQETRHPDRTLNIKLGRGGIREIEFVTQVFQLIRGGRNQFLCDQSTRKTLLVLADKKILDRAVVEMLLHAYTFLRNLEHRLQYLDDAQTHTIPANTTDQKLIANMMGYDDTADLLAAVQLVRNQVAEQFDAIFHHSNQIKKITPVTQTSFFLSETGNFEPIQETLIALEFDNVPDITQRLLNSWRSSRIQSLPETSKNKLEQLILVALPLISKLCTHKSTALYRLLDFFETIARRSAYFSLLIEYPHTLKRIITIMHASRWAAYYLTQHPILLDELLEDDFLNTPPDFVSFSNELYIQLNQAMHNGIPDTERQLDILREMHHAQLFQLLTKDLEGLLSVEQLADYLSALADITIQQTIDAIWKGLPKHHQDDPKFAVIAYGKLGGKELSYASDLDLIFLYDDPHPEAPELYAKLAQRFITWMTSHTSAGVLFDIDIELRPNGMSGMLVLSVTAFEKYQTQSAWIWEHQALTRARYCAGDPAVGQQFEHIRKTILQKHREKNTLGQAIQAMRHKMIAANPSKKNLFDLKQDSGGMIDIEFSVQFLVLLHAKEYPALTGNIGNIALLNLSAELGLIDGKQAIVVADVYRKFRKMQHILRLQEAGKTLVEPSLVVAERKIVRQFFRDVFQIE